MEENEVFFTPGVRPDERTEEEKLKDYHLGEIVAKATLVNWVVKTANTWRKFPIFNQDGSGSCVAQTLRKLLGIIVWLLYGVWLDFSATDIYCRRANQDSAGMNAGDSFAIAQAGVMLNALMPSDGMNDSQMKAMFDKCLKLSPDMIAKLREVFKAGKYVALPIGDIETIASTIQATQKGVQVYMFWNYDEYTDVPTVKNAALKSWEAQGVHSTAIVDFTLLDQSNAPGHPELWGKKALVMDDSWDKVATAMGGQRLITEDFLKTRNFYAAYIQSFKFQEGTSDAKPRYTFNKDLSFIAWDTKTNAPADQVKNAAQYTDTVALQNCLKWLGIFPVNTDSTGYFGAVTKDAVAAFQDRYGIAKKGDAGYGVCGPKTRAQFNSLFG